MLRRVCETEEKKQKTAKLKKRETERERELQRAENAKKNRIDGKNEIIFEIYV